MHDTSMKNRLLLDLRELSGRSKKCLSSKHKRLSHSLDSFSFIIFSLVVISPLRRLSITRIKFRSRVLLGLEKCKQKIIDLGSEENEALTAKAFV